MKLFDILDFTVVDAIDILLFASLLYYLYRLIRGTVAINIFMGIVIIYLIWKITEALQMQLLSSILGQFIGVGVFALIVVFQQEIRRFLLTLGSTNITARNKLQRVFHFFKEKEIVLNIESLVNVCLKLGTTNTGALIVLEHNMPLDFVTETGDKVNIEFSEPIIESIFYKNSPLHVWSDPSLMPKYAANVAEALIKADPQNKTYYNQRLQSYTKELQQLDTYAKMQFDRIPAARRKVLTGHEAFGYMGKRYNIKFYAPQGINTESEPSAKHVAALIRQVKQEGIKAVFTENIKDSRMLERIAKESGSTIGGKLYSDALSKTAPANTYTGMMRYNVDSLVKAMK